MPDDDGLPWLTAPFPPARVTTREAARGRTSAHDFASLRADYAADWARMQIAAAKQAEINQTVSYIAARQARYAAVAAETSVPWHVIALIHSMEARLSFNAHLHNGDPLTARTVNQPTGRPPIWLPPSSWEDSARDALELDNMTGHTDWSLEMTAYRLESYNGFGYRSVHPPIHSPYLWAYSDLYTAGKFTSDNKYSATAISRQCGAMVLLRALCDHGLVNVATQTV